MIRSVFESVAIHAVIILTAVAVSVLGYSGGSGGPVTIRMSTSIIQGDPAPGVPEGTAEVNEQAKSAPVVEQVSAPVHKPVTPVQRPKAAPAPVVATAVPLPELPQPSQAECCSVSDNASSSASPGGEGTGEENLIAKGDNGTGTDVAGGGGAPGPAGDGVFSLRDVDYRPKALSSYKPEYPRYAKENRIEGNVTVSFVLSPDGTVRDAVIISADPANVFEASALAAVKKWRFSPAKKQGKAVPARMVVAVNFSLEEY